MSELNCEHEYENDNCTNCANGLPCSAYECAKTKGTLKEYCHEKAEESRKKRAFEIMDKLYDNCINNHIDDVPFPSEVLKLEIEKIKKEL